MTTQNVYSLFIDGSACEASDAASIPLVNPATEDSAGRVAKATQSDMDRALAAAERGFRTWRRMSALERSKVLRKAAALIREQTDEVALQVCRQQGKPVAEARIEWQNCADIFEWAAEEGRRAYGRLIPARVPHVVQTVRKEPVGPVAAFTPWNFPASQAAKKLGFSLAAGCSIILKGPEETPAACVALVNALHEAGAPAGVVNLLFGEPATISEYLIASPVIKKVSFTGSVPVGKILAGLAARHMKPCTLELGGHAPVLVFDDVDPENAAEQFVKAKFRNSGQVCISPTRFYIQEGIYERFAARFAQAASELRVGDGSVANTDMGPLANKRRIGFVQTLVDDAVDKGAKLLTGGNPIAGKGYFFHPTVLGSVPDNARIKTEEPFGPVALLETFTTIDDALEKANSTSYGLASYAFTNSAAIVEHVSREINAGMLAINHFGLGVAEAPFGGIGDSGYGREGGIEGLEGYITTKYISHLTTAV